MSCPSSRALAVSILPALLLLACGDDTTSPPAGGSTSDAGTTTGMEGTGSGSSSTQAGESSTGDDSTTSDTDASTTDAESSTGSAESSSSTGTPNEPPVGEADFYFTNTAARSLNVDAAQGVLANDSDPEAEALTVSAFEAASEAGGVVAVMPDGSFVYTAPEPFWGEDAFSYTVEDASGGTAQARVRVAVAPTWEGIGDVVPATAGAELSGATSNDLLGAAVATGSDVNGDGFADVVFGADGALDDGGGAAYVLLGGPDAGSTTAGDLEAGMGGFIIVGPAAADATGNAVAMLGDVNGDGLGDIAVGVSDGTGPGDVYVVFGTETPSAVDLDALGAGGFVVSGGASFGMSVGAAGDVNDDGLQDIIIGEPQADGDGIAVVVFGKSDNNPVDSTALGSGGYRLEASSADGEFGSSVAGVGDVDGDGYDDVAVGARLSGGDGRVFVFYGKTDTDTLTEDTLAMDATAGISITASEDAGWVGHSVAGAGDVNGDGRPDILFGAPAHDIDGELSAGRAFLVYGSTELASMTTDDLVAGTGGISFAGESQFDFAGWSVGAAGDLDRDGFADVVIGVQGIDDPVPNGGRAYVLYGAADLVGGSLADFPVGDGGFVLAGDAFGDSAGHAVHGSGDFNGDGFDDLALGLPEVGPDTGMGLSVFGGNYSASDVLGSTADADVITGTAGAETLVGGRGDDELVSGGGLDIMCGGEGDDVLSLVDAGFYRLDGGAGLDTVRLEGGGFGLDLDNYFDVAIRDIEAIDLTGDGDNTLFLNTHQLLALSSTSNTLFVHGDAGDQVVADLSGAGFVDQGSDGTATTWSNGVASLVIDDLVEAFVTP